MRSPRNFPVESSVRGQRKRHDSLRSRLSASRGRFGRSPPGDAQRAGRSGALIHPIKLWRTTVRGRILGIMDERAAEQPNPTQHRDPAQRREPAQPRDPGSGHLQSDDYRSASGCRLAAQGAIVPNRPCRSRKSTVPAVQRGSMLRPIAEATWLRGAMWLRGGIGKSGDVPVSRPPPVVGAPGRNSRVPTGIAGRAPPGSARRGFTRVGPHPARSRVRAGPADAA